MREKPYITFRQVVFAPRAIVTMLLAALATSLSAAPAQAESLSAYLETVRDTVALSAVFLFTPAEERDIIKTAYKSYLLQQKNKPVPRVGQVSIDDNYPTSYVMTGDGGVATFHFVDTTSELPAAGPDVDEVVYEWDTDPTDAISWVFLGSSTNPLDDFAVPFTQISPYPYEALIRATPYFTGSPVEILGVDDENVAVGIAAALVPEPTSILLAAPAMFALWMARGRRGLRRRDRRPALADGMRRA
jgi:hypothetical protein